MNRLLVLGSVAVLTVASFVTADDGYGTTAAVCHCGAQPPTGTYNLPHAAEVDVTVHVEGGGTTTVEDQSTGQTGSTPVTVGTGKCKYIRYYFICDQVAQSWTCAIQSWTVLERAATGAECP